VLKGGGSQERKNGLLCCFVSNWRSYGTFRFLACQLIQACNV
jgi:hypothetical protein